MHNLSNPKELSQDREELQISLSGETITLTPIAIAATETPSNKAASTLNNSAPSINPLNNNASPITNQKARCVVIVIFRVKKRQNIVVILFLILVGIRKA